MTNSSTFRVTFHVTHPAISAPEIMKAFELPTRYHYSVGEQKMTKQGDILNGVYDRSHVSFILHEKPFPFSQKSVVDFILEFIDTFDIGYLNKIYSTGGEFYFLIGVFSSSSVMFEFNTKTIQYLASVNIGLKFDFYGGEN